MANWEKFEDECFKYLKGKYHKDAKIDAYGKSDSTKADIEITPSNDVSFFVEVKSSDAQCCQFVLFPDKKKKKFLFSKSNKTPKTDACNKIISYMNRFYKKFSKVNSSGIPIKIDQNILYELVSDFYKSKDVKFFMTKNEDYIIFPIEDFSSYFDICALYRKKRSGSSMPNEKNNRKEIESGLVQYDIKGTITFNVSTGTTRCFLHTDNGNLHNKRIICDNYTYLFKDNTYSQALSTQLSQYAYEIRRLSNTNNPNVICQLSLKNKEQNAAHLAIFEKSIKQEDH